MNLLTVQVLGIVVGGVVMKGRRQEWLVKIFSG